MMFGDLGGNFKLAQRHKVSGEIIYFNAEEDMTKFFETNDENDFDFLGFQMLPKVVTVIDFREDGEKALDFWKGYFGVEPIEPVDNMAIEAELHTSNVQSLDRWQQNVNVINNAMVNGQLDVGLLISNNEAPINCMVGNSQFIRGGYCDLQPILGVEEVRQYETEIDTPDLTEDNWVEKLEELYASVKAPVILNGGFNIFVFEPSMMEEDEIFFEGVLKVHETDKLYVYHKCDVYGTDDDPFTDDSSCMMVLKDENDVPQGVFMLCNEPFVWDDIEEPQLTALKETVRQAVDMEVTENDYLISHM